MAVTVELGPQVPIGVRIGYAKAPTAKLIVMSLTSGAITVACNAVNYVVTPTATDADGGAHSPAGYVGAVTITGLAEFTAYTYTVTQAGNAGSVSGSFRTLPSQNDDFCFYFLTCDAGAGVAGGQHTGHGFYKNIRQQIAAGGLPCVGILHLDDHGYNANRLCITGKADSLNTSNAATLNTEYAFSAAWLNFYGLHSSTSASAGLGEADIAVNTYANNDIGRSPDRVWCMQNLAVWPQWGDWEFANDIGFDFPTTSPTAVANPYHKTYTGGVGNKDGGGYLAWQRFMAPIQPPLLNAANGNAWSMDLGCTRIIATDGVTNSNGTVTNYNSTIATNDSNVTQITSILGSGQITDIRNAGLHQLPFTFLGLMNGVRYMADVTYEWESGTQHPIKNHCPAEFASLFTSAGSLSDKPATLFTMNGDYHNGHVYHHRITDGALPASFYEIGAGTLSRSTNFSADQVLSGTPLGGAYKGSVVEYISQGVGVDWANHTYWGVKVSVRGSKQTREITIELMGSSSQVLWSGRFLGWTGSNKVGADLKISNITGTAHG